MNRKTLNASIALWDSCNLLFQWRQRNSWKAWRKIFRMTQISIFCIFPARLLFSVSRIFFELVSWRRRFILKIYCSDIYTLLRRAILLLINRLKLFVFQIAYDFLFEEAKGRKSLSKTRTNIRSVNNGKASTNIVIKKYRLTRNRCKEKFFRLTTIASESHIR